MRLQSMKTQNIVFFLLLIICAVFFITGKNTVYAASNTSFNSAMTVCVNQLYTNSNSEGESYYAFTIDNDGYISISFTHDYDDTCFNNAAFGLTIYDSDYNRIETTYVNGITECNITTIRNGLPAGKYYLKVGEGFWGDMSKKVYNFQINYNKSDSWETELNNEFEHADNINLNQTVYGSGISGDDYFKFYIPKAATIKIHFIHDYDKNVYNNAAWGLTLYDNYYRELQTTWVSGTDCNINSETIFLSAGTYYLKIADGFWGRKSSKEYNLEIIPHTHSYTERITRATTSTNGKIVKQCSCGVIQSMATIYYPKTITLSSTSYLYDGKQKKPSVSVRGSDGRVIDSSNYSISYTNGRKNIGTYKVTLKFKGNYSGITSKTFKINPKSTSLSKLTASSKQFTVKWKKRTDQITGYQIQYSTNKKFTNSTTKTISQSSIASTTCKGLKAKKKYYVHIRTYKKVSGISYYSLWSPIKMVKV